MANRVVLLIDMDCFYVQVEQQLHPETLGKPAIVAQYNTWKGGGIIAVNYEARACGVTRGMRGDEARRLCPELVVFRVPEVRGKADINRYREAGRRVIDALRPFTERLERASVDEAYVELTAEAAARLASGPLAPEHLANTFVVGYGGDEKTEECRKAEVEAFLESVNSEFASPGDRLLAAGAAICEQMRKAVHDQTGYRCSAGIAHNKVLAKLCAGKNKPNRQTILPHGSVAHLYSKLPVKKVRLLGGKLGDAVTEQLGCETMADLGRLSLAHLQAAFDEKTGAWLYQLARGFDSEPVADRHLPKSIGCSKNFRGPEVLRTRAKVKHWLTQLASEASERLKKDREANQRTSRSLTVYVTTEAGRHVSRACALTGYDADTIAADAFVALGRLNTARDGDQAWVPPLINLGISAGKFSEVPSAACGSIAAMFSRLPTPARAGEAATTAEEPAAGEGEEEASGVDRTPAGDGGTAAEAEDESAEAGEIALDAEGAPGCAEVAAEVRSADAGEISEAAGGSAACPGKRPSEASDSEHAYKVARTVQPGGPAGPSVDGDDGSSSARQLSSGGAAGPDAAACPRCGRAPSRRGSCPNIFDYHVALELLRLGVGSSGLLTCMTPDCGWGRPI
ncbi:DNA polymerase eta-like [Pollicipes pollicipes]|uniref:DNA polymerase eta-like n=1 Tax=Pollicipes pollicipes TaxID=41117 RepID=UPI0018850C44|nr:DNA polymerase eta-like [Pollicipes pollicipes]